MRLSTATTTSVLLALASSTLAINFTEIVQEIPPCTLGCFTEAVGKTGCDFIDIGCQCTHGKEVITSHVMTCLCSTQCNTDDLLNALHGTNRICHRALDALGETYVTPLIQTFPCLGTNYTARSTVTSAAGKAAVPGLEHVALAALTGLALAAL